VLVRCAWCGKNLGEKPPYGGRHDTEVTHGICDDCRRKYFGGEKEAGEDGQE